MSEQSHPPYVSGALTIPRQLERWLDVNPQNGPLKRTEKYFTLRSFDFGMPALQIGFPYEGVIVTPCVIGMVFNYTSPNVFSLKVGSPSEVTSLSTCTLVIASSNGDNTLTRYILWQGTPVIPLSIPTYAGQPIAKVFRIEVWVTYGPQQEYTDSASQIIQTSVKGNVDYRYGTDSALETLTSSVGSSQATDAFGVTLPAALPMVMPVNTYL